MKKLTILLLFIQSIVFAQKQDTVILSNITIYQVDTSVFVRVTKHNQIKDVNIIDYLSDYFKFKYKLIAYRKI